MKLFAFVKSPGICNGAYVCCRTRQSLRLQTTPRLFIYDNYQSNNFLELPVRRSNLLLFVEHVVASPYLRATPSTCVVDIYSFPYLSGGATVLWISVWKVFYRSYTYLEKPPIVEYLCKRYSIVSTRNWRSYLSVTYRRWWYHLDLVLDLDG